MSNESREDSRTWQRIETALRLTPPVAPDAIDRVMARVHRTEMEPGVPDAPTPRVTHWFLRPHTFRASPIQLLAASLLVTLSAYAMLRGHRVQDAGTAAARSAPVTVSGPIAAQRQTAVGVPASRSSDLQPTQFVFVAKDARQVTIAGDFNDWNATSAPMQKLPNGVWSIVLPLAPGRHVYSFVVDGRRWVPDAAAPRAPENDFGAESSIVLVERT